jgi:protein-S-isoprenylcysteine O-methyltransferase Ste14
MHTINICPKPLQTNITVAALAGGLILQRFLGSWPPLILMSAAVLAVRRLVIDPEERFLTLRFGSIYDEYRRLVARWL